MGFRVDREIVAGSVVLRLRDEDSGASASILPGCGFNLFDLQLPAAGTRRPIVASAPEWWAETPHQTTKNGIPILFPFPNRIRDARFEFQGKGYQLVANKGPNAIHGFATDVAWEVLEAGPTAEGARAVGRFQISRQATEDLDRWPSDASLEVAYTLAGQRLTLDAVAVNEGESNLPWGFGIHPYFRLPFDPSGDRSRTQVILPATETWVLEDALPTGERQLVGPRTDFREGKAIEGLAVDDVLTGLEFDGETCTCRLVDEDLAAEFQIRFGRDFRDLVVFAPPFLDGGVIAVEPYTQTTDAINLEARGIEAGLRVLPPGGEARLRVVMEMVDRS